MSDVQCPMSEVPCLAEAEDPDNSRSTGADSEAAPSCYELLLYISLLL